MCKMIRLLAIGLVMGTGWIATAQAHSHGHKGHGAHHSHGHKSTDTQPHQPRYAGRPRVQGRSCEDDARYGHLICWQPGCGLPEAHDPASSRCHRHGSCRPAPCQRPLDATTRRSRYHRAAARDCGNASLVGTPRGDGAARWTAAAHHRCELISYNSGRPRIAGRIARPVVGAAFGRPAR